MTDVNETVRPWQYSVKLEVNAKGYVQPSIHVMDDNLTFLKVIDNNQIETINIEWSAVELLDRLVKQLKDRGFKVATDIDAQKV